MKKTDLKIQSVILPCGCDRILPLCFVYIFYIVLHGHLSPGGGFQGGILTVAVIILLYMGHGYETTRKTLNPNVMGRLEGVALIIYVCLAFAGIAFAAQFCQNFAYMNGNIGDLLSSGTIFGMNAAVALDVLSGASVLSIGLISTLFVQDENMN